MRSVMVMVLALLAGGLQAGEIKRWVDAEGRVHFGDQAPASVDAVVQEIEQSGVDSAPSNPGLRPGERAMVERYEQRGRELEAAKQRSSQAYEKQRLSKGQEAKQRARCDYYLSRVDHYRGKKRRGYSRSEGDKIDAQIELYEMKSATYCD